MTLNVATILRRKPAFCFWEITDACNLRCLHCEADAGRWSPDELRTDEALGIVDQLAQAACEQLFLTGGEPLLRKDWPLIARRARDQGMSVTIITNGVLVDSSSIHRMLESGVTGLSVSLDGDREVHDALRIPASASIKSSYDLAIHAIELGVASPIKTAVISQVHLRNIDNLRALYEQMVSLNIAVWQVQICMPLGRMRKRASEYVIAPSQLRHLSNQLAQFIEEGRLRIAVGDNIGYYGPNEPTLRGSLRDTKSFWMGCLAGCRSVGLCSNGDVKGCPSHPRSMAVGNLRDTPFGEIWDDTGRFSYNTEWNEQLLEGNCRDCAFRRLCRAGCKSMALATTGTIYNNVYCEQPSRDCSHDCAQGSNGNVRTSS